jgi:NDP-sugar pyrophosphorylase family protein
MNGDELVDVDFGALLARHETAGAAATIVVAPLRSPYGVVDLDGDSVTGFREAPELPFWVNCGVYVLGEEALDRLPERGDHERSTFPELAAGGRLAAYRHRGVWLTVNTPKELRAADEYLKEHPQWLASS